MGWKVRFHLLGTYQLSTGVSDCSQLAKQGNLFGKAVELKRCWHRCCCCYGWRFDLNLGKQLDLVPCQEGFPEVGIERRSLHCLRVQSKSKTWAAWEGCSVVLCLLSMAWRHPPQQSPLVLVPSTRCSLASCRFGRGPNHPTEISTETEKSWDMMKQIKQAMLKQRNCTPQLSRSSLMSKTPFLLINPA